MTTYRAIASTETDADSPVTATLMDALKDNVLAIQELDSTAPKIKVSVETGVANSGGSFDINGLGDFDGVEILGETTTSGTSETDALSISLSDDGVSFATATTLVSTSTTYSGRFQIFVNLSDGVYSGWETWGGHAANTISGTLTLPSGTVTHVRLAHSSGVQHTTVASCKRTGEII